jgi:hypothetical protein
MDFAAQLARAIRQRNIEKGAHAPAERTWTDLTKTEKAAPLPPRPARVTTGLYEPRRPALPFPSLVGDEGGGMIGLMSVFAQMFALMIRLLIWATWWMPVVPTRAILRSAGRQQRRRTGIGRTRVAASTTETRGLRTAAASGAGSGIVVGVDFETGHPGSFRLVDCFGGHNVGVFLLSSTP